MVIGETFQVIYSFFLAIALGALIGVEREKSHQQHKGTDFAGIRTFMLITFFGAMAAYLASLYYSWLLAILIVCFVIVVVAAYVLSSYFNKEVGMTTGLSSIIAFVIGILVFTTPIEIPILLTISVTLILSFKSILHQFVYNLKSNEFFDTLKFLVIAFVILPLLKHIGSFGPYNAINLYEIWLMVVFVSGLSYVGYILIKVFGSKKGTLLTGFLGGILSSTAVVISLAGKSKEEQGNSTAYVVAAAIACSTMFIRVLIEVSILNFSMIEKLAFPMVLLAMIGYMAVSILWKRSAKTETHLSFSSPLMVSTALKFGFFYGFITILSNVLSSPEILGSKGLLVAALVSGLADVDAITIYVARTAGLDLTLGITAIVLAATVNTAVKIFIARSFGSSEFGGKLMKVMLPIVVGGLILVFLL
jgi:uncharacterized membrane protein (DUF4010 family)